MPPSLRRAPAALPSTHRANIGAQLAAHHHRSYKRRHHRHQQYARFAADGHYFGNAVPATTKLGFGTAPATPITAGGNAGTVTVLEQDVNGTTVTVAADSVTLSVTYPDSSVHSLGSATAVNGCRNLLRSRRRR